MLAVALCLSSGAARAERLGFLENRGQLSGGAAYYAAGPHAAVYLRPDAIVVDLFTVGSGPSPSDPRRRRGAAFWIRFAAGSNPCPRLEARDPLPGRFHFFRGSDAKAWVRDAGRFGEIVYGGLWPGIDLALRMEEEGLVYRITCAPGVFPASVLPLFVNEGAQRALLQPDGDLLLETGPWRLLHHPAGPGAEGMLSWGPLACPAGGEEPRDAATLGPFELGWSTFLGGTGSEEAHPALAPGADGGALVAGYTESYDLPFTPGAYDTAYDASGDAFVARLDSLGASLEWCTFLGGAGRDQATAIAPSPAGDVLVAGFTESEDFPTTPAAWDSSFGGVRDAFVAELDANGSALRWSGYLGGSDWDQAEALALSGEGAVIAGWTRSADYPTTPGAYAQTLRGGEDLFVTKIPWSGSTVLWSTFLGGTSSDRGHAVAVDGWENVVVAGETQSADYPTTVGAYDRSYGGAGDAVLSQLDPSGEALLWSTFLGSLDWEAAEAVALDGDGHAVVTGFTWSAAFPTTVGAYDRSPNGGRDVFVSKINNAGHALLWSTFLGGSSNETAWGVALEAEGNPVLCGETRSPDFPTTPRTFDATFNGEWDAFVAELDAAGTSLAWSSYLGGARTEVASAITRDGAGNVLVAGWSRSEDFPTTSGAYDPELNGSADAFVLELGLVAESAVEEAGEAGAPGGGGQSLLLPPEPNPFSRETVIRVRLARDEIVRLSVYDAGGRRVRTLAQGGFPAGERNLSWRGDDAGGSPVPPGLYFVRLERPGGSQTRKLLRLP